MAKRICKHEECQREYNTHDKKFGMIDECNTCGRNGSDAETPRLGGVMNYEHKTAGVLQVMSLEDAQSIRRKTDRTGGQGIIKGMNVRR